MTSIKLIYIDEEKEQHDDFKESFEESNEFLKDCTFEVITLFPAEDLDTMIDIIFTHQPDAIVTDFKLNEKKDHNIRYEVGYNGSQLREKVESLRVDFPCFVSSSFYGEAVQSEFTYDVSKVYSKMFDIYEPNNNINHLRLHEVIKLQVEKYRLLLENLEYEFYNLIQFRNSNQLTLKQESRLLELDKRLELMVDGRSSIPDGIKELSNADRLNTLIEKVDSLIEYIDRDNNE